MGFTHGGITTKNIVVAGEVGVMEKELRKKSGARMLFIIKKKNRKGAIIGRDVVKPKGKMLRSASQPRLIIFISTNSIFLSLP